MGRNRSLETVASNAFGVAREAHLRKPDAIAAWED